MKAFTSSVFFLGLLSASGLLAESTFTNLISCAPAFSGLVGPCTLHSSPLLSTQSYETQFTLRYHFNCHYPTSQAIDPNYLKIGIRAGEISSSARFNYNGSGEVSVIGHGPLALFDEMPIWTTNRKHAAGCNLTVSVQETKPSLNTLNQWYSDSIDESRILSLLLDKYLISKRFDRVASWNSTQLNAARSNLEEQLAALLPGVPMEQLVYPLNHPDAEMRGRLKSYQEMPQAWKDVIIFTPQLPDIVIMLSQVRAIIDGQPPVYSPADTGRYRNELNAEVAKATMMINRANEWLEKLNAEMRQAIVSLTTLRNKANQEINP